MKSDSLKDFTQRDLARLAKQQGVPGWHEMRKDQLVRVLARLAKAKREKSKLVRRSPTAKAVAVAKTNGKSQLAKSPAVKGAATSKPAANGHKSNGYKANGQKPVATVSLLVASKNGSNGHTSNGHKTNGQANGHKNNPAKNGAAPLPALKRPILNAPSPKPSPKPKSPVVVEKIQKINADREHLKDLARPFGKSDNARGPNKDRIVLLVRDPYWLHVFWEVTRNSIQRAKAAMAEQWHTARPVLRLLEVGDGATTSSAERVARDIEIHGGVQNWYIDVQDPPQHYRVAIGYLSSSGKFYALARSNSVTTPCPGSSDDLDKNWTEVAENYEKIYAQSGGYTDEGANGDLQELFEERLRRPMGAPAVARYGVGAERLLNRQREFQFEVEAALVIFGSTKSDAYVTLAGEPVKVRPDGTFTVRLALPDRRQVLPVVASSGDGIEQRTVVIAVERNTKVMEPMIRDGNE